MEETSVEQMLRLAVEALHQTRQSIRDLQVKEEKLVESLSTIVKENPEATLSVKWMVALAQNGLK